METTPIGMETVHAFRSYRGMGYLYEHYHAEGFIRSERLMFTMLSSVRGAMIHLYGR